MKRKLAIVIVFVMMVTSMPFYAFAAEGDQSDVPGAAETVLNNGEKGSEDQGSTDAVTTGEDENTADQEIGVSTGEGESVQPVIQTGWNEDHTMYYDKNGDPLKKVVRKIGGTRYYFNSKGVLDMSDGWKTANTAKYYVKKGVIVTGPTKIKVTKKVKFYYNRKTGKWQRTKISGAKTKYRKVTESTLYMFLSNGKRKDTKGLYKLKGKEYYGLGKGRLKTGWTAIKEKKKGKAVFFSEKTGAMLKNTRAKYLKIPKNGRLGEAYYLGIKRLDKIGWSLRAAFKWSAGMRYQGRWFRTKSSEKYAIKGFSKGYGNCYCMAATFYIMAKLLGYDVHQVAGKVDLPHSWTVIRQNGREWVYDPNFTNETGRNGWKIYYGKRGTWRYNSYHKMN